MAFVELESGNQDQARAFLEEAVSLVHHLDDVWSWAMSGTLLGILELAAGNLERAREQLEEGATLFQRIGNPLFFAWSLEGLAGVASADGRFDLAARLFGAREALQRRLNSSNRPAHPSGFNRAIAGVRAALGEGEFTRALDVGRRQPLDEILAEAIARAMSDAA